MLRILSIVSEEALGAELAAALRQLPDIQVVRSLSAIPSLDDLLRTVRVRRPECLLIGTDDLPRVEALITGVDNLLPGFPMIAVGREADAQRILKLMRVGVREYLTAPITPARMAEVAEAIQRQLKRHPVPVARCGDLYTFLPAKPGAGTSTIALSASCALAEELGIRTLLADCDLSAGVIKFLLKLGNSASILDAMGHAENLDEDLWSQMVGKWERLDVLHAGELDSPGIGDLTSVSRVLSMARAMYEVICADLASSLDPFSIAWMRESRRIFLVTTPEVISVHLSQNRIRQLVSLGLGDRLSLVLNRKDRRSDHLDDAEVARLVDLPVAFSFNNNYDNVQRAILGGSPVPRNSDIGQSVLSLAQSLATELPAREAQPSHRRRFLEFFHVPHAPDSTV